MSRRHRFVVMVWLVACTAAVANAQPPRSDAVRLQAMVHASRPAGLDVLNLASIDGQVRVLGTAQTLGAVGTFLERMRASGLVDAPRVDAVASPKEGPHVFAISGRDRTVAPLPLPGARYAGGE